MEKKTKKWKYISRIKTIEPRDEEEDQKCLSDEKSQQLAAWAEFNRVRTS